MAMTDATGSDTDDNAFGVETIGLDFPRPRTIRLLLARFVSDSTFWTRRGGLLHVADDKLFEPQISSAISAARRTAANALVLPELSVPESMVFHLQEWSASSGGVAVGGTHYFQRGEQYFARAPVIIAGKVYFTEKIQPAPAELSPIAGRGLTSGKHINVYSNTPIGNFAVSICSDFLVSHLRSSLLQNYLDFLFVPAFQRSSALYHTTMAVECEGSEKGVYIAYANMIEPAAADGSSALFGIVDSLWGGELVEAKVTDGQPRSKLCELGRNVQHIVVDLDIDNRRPRVGRTVQSKPNVKVIEFSLGESEKADEFTRRIAHEDERYRKLTDFFVPPLEYEEILAQLERNRLVFIVGDPGIGKTYTAASVLKVYFDKGYEPVWFTGIEREERQLQRQTLESYVPKAGQVIYFEDPFGRTSFERRDVLFTVFRPLIDQLRHVDARIVVTSRREVFERFSEESLSMPELSALRQDMGVVKPSYSREQLWLILEKLAQNRCKWFENYSLRLMVANAIRDSILCTPWAIRDFVFASESVINKAELRDHIRSRNSENSLNFAQEISAGRTDDQLLFILIYLFGTYESSTLAAWYTEVKKRLRHRDFEVGVATFSERLRSHLGFRIEQFGSKRAGIRFTHPIYEEAVAQATARNETTFAIAEEILRVVRTGSLLTAVQAISRNGIKHPYLASRLFNAIADDSTQRLTAENMILVGEKLVAAFRNTKFDGFLKTLARVTKPSALAKFINSTSSLGELPRYLRLARNYQQLLRERSPQTIGSMIDWQQVFRRLSSKPRLGPWWRVVEVALWFDKTVPLEFLNRLPPTVLRSRFLELPTADRSRLLAALSQTALSDRLAKIQGTRYTRLADVKFEELTQWMEVHDLDRGVVVDAGAAAAITLQRRNLLPPGVKDVVGSFIEGDLISVFAQEGTRLGIAYSEYSSEEISLIKGFHSSQIPEILGIFRGMEIIRRRQFRVDG